ncbi:MAG: hypothetical protein ACK587_17435 [Cyanobacteriota bacterium]
MLERVTESGIEIRPIELDELDQAIAIRVSKFHSSGHGKAPLTRKRHQNLLETSRGELRFHPKYSNSVCVKLIESTGSSVLAKSVFSKPQGKALKESIHMAINRVIAESMIGQQIADHLAEVYLKQIDETDLNGLFLKPTERSVLQGIGKAGKARASDFKSYSLRTMQDFSSNYLAKVHYQNLLFREQEGREG